MKISWTFDKLIEIMKRNTFNHANVNCAYCSTTASAVAVNSLLPCRDVCVRVSETRSNLLLFFVLLATMKWNETKRAQYTKNKKISNGYSFPNNTLWPVQNYTHTHTRAHTFERAHVEGKFANLGVSVSVRRICEIEPLSARQGQLNLISIFIKYR